MKDGRGKMKDGGWRMEDGGWKLKGWKKVGENIYETCLHWALLALLQDVTAHVLRDAILGGRRPSFPFGRYVAIASLRIDAPKGF